MAPVYITTFNLLIYVNSKHKLRNNVFVELSEIKKCDYPKVTLCDRKKKFRGSRHRYQHFAKIVFIMGVFTFIDKRSYFDYEIYFLI